MSTQTALPAAEGTMADLLDRLGNISPERILMRPAPGTANEKDAVLTNDRFDHLCELIDGVLVEKPMGFYESRLAVVLSHLLETYLSSRNLGFVLGTDAMLQYEPGQIRMPDVSVFLWHRFPGRILPTGAILRMTPDLAVEVLSPTNTVKEMDRKLRELFAGGAKLVWHVDPVERAVQVFTGVDESTMVNESQTLDGGNVLPGFSLPLRELFTRAGQRAAPEA